MRGHTILVAAVVGALLAGCSSAPARSTRTAPAAARLRIPPGAVPWAPLPYIAYLPTPLPSPTPRPAPQCGTAELRAASLEAAGATGNDGVLVALTNTSRTTCLAQNYPRVTLYEADHTAILASSGGFFDGAEPIGDVPPGAKAAFTVSGSWNCSDQQSPPHATRLTAQLPGGGIVGVALPGTYAPGSNASLLTVPTACGVWATHMFPFPVSQTPPPLPADPLAQLTATISVSQSVVDGHPIMYVVDLHNPSDHTVALSPCRGYWQTLDNTKTPSFAYELNCPDAGAIPARGDEAFVIEMPQYTAVPGDHTLCWDLDSDGNSKPPVCAALTIVP